ncbi:MAG: hypothetical protein WBX25_26455 [Rhodomicrobium sp.]
MKKLGLILAAIIVSGASLSAPSLAQESARHVWAQKKAHPVSYWYAQRTDGGPYHQDRLPDGTLTGPISNENSGGE